jgi:transglutaminase-like putative cysteine protease
MSDDGSSSAFGDVSPGRNYATVGLVICALVAVLLATTLLPAAASLALADVPGSSMLPIPEEARGQSGGLGALNAGSEQPVGGSLTDDGSAFRSQNTDVHFVVTSPRPSYWRTGSYDEYTGDGWERNGDSNAEAPLDGERLQYEVELKQQATTAPVVWRPTAIDEGPLELTDSLTAESDSSMASGTTYVAVSFTPPSNASVLRASGRDYPDGLEDRYTELPEETRDRVTPFTDDLTADADSTFDTAVAVEQWLETNKSYSLEVEQPPDDDVATQFIFDMERGYCEYFATAMTVMLRSQDIPARYVVGYSTGQQTGENTYTVRGMNAHAWVEVYFEGVGWVRFDPTPGQARLAQEQDTFEQNESGDYAPVEEGSPGEFSSPTSEGRPGGSGGGNGGGTDGNDDTNTPIEGAENATYDVSLNRTAVPGATVQVRVTQAGAPVDDAEVRFNGDLVGTTDLDGTVVADVPYSDELRISVSGGERVTFDVTGANVTEPVADVDRATAGGLPPPSATRQEDVGTATRRYSVDTATAGLAAAASEPAASGAVGLAGGGVAAQDTNVTQSFTVETNATLSVSGTIRTTNNVVVTATVDGVPVEDAAVYRGDTQVGRTDQRGRAEVQLPDSPGNVTLSVRRDPISGNRTLLVPALNVSVDPTWPLPVAGTPVRVVSFMGEQPASGATVLVGDRQVGTTDTNGTAVASLPFASQASVGVAASGQTARATVTNPLVNTVAVLVAVIGVGGTAALVFYRKDPRAMAGAVAAGVFGVYRLLVRLLVGTVFAVERAAVALLARVRATASYARDLVTGHLSPAAAAAAFRGWLRAWRARLRERGRAIASALSRETATTAGTDGSHASVRAAWTRFLGYLSVRRAETKTPGQLATHAIDVDELPPRAVTTLRDEFRAVEYGPRSADDSVGPVEAAIETIDRRVREREADEDGDTDDGSDREANPDAGDGTPSRTADATANERTEDDP